MFEIGIVGAENSGKTTLLEALIPALASKGIKAATIKHTGHTHRFDTEGKDSFRHRGAGAVATIAVSEAEMALFAGADKRLLTRLIETLNDFCDICLVEGDKGNSRQKILLTRNLKNIKGLIPGNVIASYGDRKFREGILHFDLNKVDLLADFIIQASALVQNGRINHAE